MDLAGIEIHLLVEDASMEAAIKILCYKLRKLPKLQALGVSFKVIPMRNKQRMLEDLPAALKSYASEINSGKTHLRILVLLDCDEDSCETLKRELEGISRAAKLPTKTHPGPRGIFYAVNRIAIEELEAWFIGDPQALRSAFPSLPAVSYRGIFRNPDNVQGGTWEALHRFLKNHGIYRSTYPKIKAAKKIAPHMEPERNRSASFQQFWAGVQAFFP